MLFTYDTSKFTLLHTFSASNGRPAPPADKTRHVTPRRVVLSQTSRNKGKNKAVSQRCSSAAGGCSTFQSQDQVLSQGTSLLSPVVWGTRSRCRSSVVCVLQPRCWAPQLSEPSITSQPHSSPRHFMLFFLPAFNFVRIETPTLWAMIFLRHSAVCQWRPQSSELWSYLVYIRVYLFCFVLDREITGNSKASSFSSLSPLMESLTIHRESERLNNSGSRRPRFTSGRAWKRTFALRLRPESVGCP